MQDQLIVSTKNKKKILLSSRVSNEYCYNFNNYGILSLRAFSFPRIFMLSHPDSLVTSLINDGKRAGNSHFTGGRAHICSFWTFFRQHSWRLHDEWGATDWSYCAFVILLHFFKKFSLSYAEDTSGDQKQIWDTCTKPKYNNEFLLPELLDWRQCPVCHKLPRVVQIYSLKTQTLTFRSTIQGVTEMILLSCILFLIHHPPPLSPFFLHSSWE